MSTKTKIFIGIALAVLIVITIIVVQYNKRRGPSTESSTYTKQTSGLAAVGGIGSLFSLFGDGDGNS